MVLPLRTSVRGPAPTTEESDVIDEALKYFRANIFFKNYKLLGRNQIKPFNKYRTCRCRDYISDSFYYSLSKVGGEGDEYCGGQKETSGLVQRNCCKTFW